MTVSYHPTGMTATLVTEVAVVRSPTRRHCQRCGWRRVLFAFSFTKSARREPRVPVAMRTVLGAPMKSPKVYMSTQVHVDRETDITVRLYDEGGHFGIVNFGPSTVQIFLTGRAECDRLITALQEVREHLLDRDLVAAVDTSYSRSHPKEKAS